MQVELKQHSNQAWLRINELTHRAYMIEALTRYSESDGAEIHWRGGQKYENVLYVDVCPTTKWDVVWDEIFVPVPGMEGYLAISQRGRVLSLPRNLVADGCLGRWPYVRGAMLLVPQWSNSDMWVKTSIGGVKHRMLFTPLAKKVFNLETASGHVDTRSNNFECETPDKNLGCDMGIDVPG